MRGLITIRDPRHVDGVGTGIADRPHRLRQRLHGEEIALHVGVMDDRRHASAGVIRRLALATLIGVGDRLLGGGFRNRDTLHADAKPGIVHHGEHAGEALVLLADQPADGAGFGPWNPSP